MLSIHPLENVKADKRIISDNQATFVNTNPIHLATQLILTEIIFQDYTKRWQKLQDIFLPARVRCSQGECRTFIFISTKGGESGVEGSAYNEKLNREMSGSKRRSRLGLGVSSSDFSSPKIVCGDNLGVL